MTLKEIRTGLRLTQVQAAAMLGVSLRSYKSYETDPQKADTLKYRYMVQLLEEQNQLDETHGLLTVEEITRLCGERLRSVHQQVQADGV